MNGFRPHLDTLWVKVDKAATSHYRAASGFVEMPRPLPRQPETPTPHQRASLSHGGALSDDRFEAVVAGVRS